MISEILENFWKFPEISGNFQKFLEISDISDFQQETLRSRRRCLDLSENFLKFLKIAVTCRNLRKLQ
jgi:hypothetical protein